MTANNYHFTPEMKKEISGKSGGYEKACRRMLRQGLRYWDRNPTLDPRYNTFKNNYGIYVTLFSDNEDARRLDSAITNDIPSGVTIAMHQAVVESIFWIRQNGWEAYVREMMGA